MDFIPQNVSMAVAQLKGFNMNKFKLESNGSSTAGPSSILTFNLPSMATLFLPSLKFHLDISTSADTSQTNAIYGKLPADTSSLIQNFEMYIGGVQVCNGFNEFNTVSKVKKIIHTSRDRDGSVDGLLYHGKIDADDAIETVSVIFQPNIGFFAENSVKYLSTSLTGDITIRLTLASNNVLAYKEATVNLGNNFSDNAHRGAAVNPTFSVTNLFATINTVSMGETYEQLLMDRLTREEYLPVNFKEYYTFALHGTNSAAHSIRFALSVTSLDRLYTLMRNGNYQSSGIKTQTYSGAENNDDACANFFKFNAFNNSTTAKGSLKYQYNVSNVLHPQYQADSLDAASDLIMCTNQHGLSGRGNMISSLADFYDGKFVIPLILSKPDEPIQVQSGLNSRGNNTQMSIDISGLTIPAANANSQVLDSISTLVIAETTSQLRISGMFQVSVSH
jgi:hypothetical protein